ncbi:putative ATP-binding cassette transporter [Paraburkholderia bannensis]|uniref:Putative ATP-binding cassette transporter n=1 Tax=Paraburkholderia bannensis TaxID=765414 RepID=A0A7W9TUZ7_9BURK|nr:MULTISPECIES: cyclic peptide export ABC transporter [Paraburkholderia]MBB3256959.1 putative ATP-binding cassette transporter [Paraburkholderia sp. WP4_3_2]MBB6101913.1 putative ATP-binding cassette transporter [Paraburkholderia bannensis]
MRSNAPNPPRTLAMLIGQVRGRLALATGASILSGLAGVALVALLNTALNVQAAELPGLGWRFLVVCSAALVLRLVAVSVFVNLTQTTLASLRRHLSTHIRSAPYRQIETIGAARLQSLASDDAALVATLFASLPIIVMNGAIVAGSLVYLGMLSWRTLLFVAAALGLGSLAFHLAHGRAMVYLRKAGTLQDASLGYFGSLIAGAKELKLNRKRGDEFLDKVLSPALESVRSTRVRGMLIYSGASNFGLFLLYVIIGVTTFFFTRYAGLDAHTSSGFVVVFLYLMVPLDSLLNNLPQVQLARVALERIENAVQQMRNAETPALDNGAAPAFSRIDVNGLQHSYYHERADEIFQLGPIELSFTPGEIVFLVGGNGSGKTTLAKLLTGLYVAEKGELRIDGHLVDDTSRDAYRQQFSAIFSDFHLFDSLVGLPREGLDRLGNELLKRLHLDHKVRVNDGAFSTRDLSQGQRKRLALVVAYLEDRPFYVFDEWAADQDPAFKDVFYQVLLPDLRARGKTVLAISHDDRYFHLADRRIKLEDGQIVENVRVREQATV